MKNSIGYTLQKIAKIGGIVVASIYGLATLIIMYISLDALSYDITAMSMTAVNSVTTFVMGVAGIALAALVLYAIGEFLITHHAIRQSLEKIADK